MKKHLVVISVLSGAWGVFGVLALGRAEASPASDSPAQEISKIQRNKDTKNIYESEFRGTFFSARTKKERLSQGSVIYQAPRSFRWEVKSPEQELYVSSGEVLWKYNAQNKHAQQVPLKDSGLDFLKAVMDPADLSARYSIEPWVSAKKSPAEKNATSFDEPPTVGAKAAAPGSQIFVKLVPKAQGNPEEFLYLVADASNGQVDEIRIAFRNGNRNTIRFEKWSVSKNGAEVFRFEPSKGTAVDKL